MKYLKEFKIFESKSEIDSICKKYGIENYTINENGSVDVNGDVNLSNKGLTKLPLKFGKVSGGFYCSNNKLTSLEGCPKEVGVNFRCSHNELTSLEGCPKEVGGFFDCSGNQLTTLEGCPEKVGGFFDCSGNQLTSLEGCPKEVGSGFSCSSNQLKVLKYEDLMSINFVSSYFNIKDNPIYQVYKIFNDFKIFKESLEWNYLSEPNLISKIRLQGACEILSEETGEDLVIPKKIKEYEFI